MADGELFVDRSDVRFCFRIGDCRVVDRHHRTGDACFGLDRGNGGNAFRTVGDLHSALRDPRGVPSLKKRGFPIAVLLCESERHRP